MRLTTVLAACLMVVIQGAGASPAERRGATGRPPNDSKVLTAAPDVVRTIIYDTGFNAGFAPDVGNRAVGNAFLDTKGLPFITGMITMLTLFPERSGIQSFTAWSLPNSMGTAMALAPFQQANFVAGQFNVVTLATPIPTLPNFIVTFIGAFNGPPGLLGLDSMSNLSRGFHAVQGDYVAPDLVGVASIPNRNAMLRITGNLLFIPVELMTFEIRD
jgi:hypothetical protein